jgi:energy-coupling factor transport system ATP-binding protein
MLELEGICYQSATAATPVLNGIDLALAPGQLGLVAGRSGCGKTTLLEVISGLAEPSAGLVRWQGRKLSGRQRRWLCGLVFQFPERHFLGLTVGQELKLGHRRLSAEDGAAVLAQVGLEGLAFTQAPEQLSGGQQRRLALAVQLLRRPSVLLLDEPTAGLDWSVSGEILALLERLAHDRCVLVVSHEPELFAGLAGPSWSLEHGRLRTMPRELKAA